MKSRYLHLISLENAREILFGISSAPGGTTVIPVEESAGWITAAPVFTKYRIPLTDLAAMDGYAVRTCDTLGASDHNPVRVCDSVRIQTGGVIPEGYDAVVMAEDCWIAGDGITIRKSVYPGQHLRRAGEDVKEGQMVISSGHRIRPEEVGALASYGVTSLTVRTCSVGIIPTGGEVIEPGSVLTAGQVIDGNTRMAMAFIKTSGIDCRRYPICPDDADSLQEMVMSAASVHDLVIISAGSSTGSRDYTASVVQNLGTLFFHGVAIKPGKPVLAGKIGNAVIIGLPGYPLSAQVVLRELIMPLLQHWGFFFPQASSARATLTRPVVSEPGIREYIPVTAGKIDGRLLAFPQPGGAAVQMASIRSNGYFIIPSESEGMEADEEVLIYFTADRRVIDQTVLIGAPLTPLTDLVQCSFPHLGLNLVPVRSDARGAVSLVLGGVCQGALVYGEAWAARSNDPGLMRTMVCKVPYGIAYRNEKNNLQKDFNHLGVTQEGSTAREVYESSGAPGTKKGSFINCTAFRDEDNVANAVKSGHCDAGTMSGPLARSYGLVFVPMEEIPVYLYNQPGKDARLAAVLEFFASAGWKDMARSAGYSVG